MLQLLCFKERLNLSPRIALSIHKPGARPSLTEDCDGAMHSNMDDYYSLVFEYHLC